MKHSKIIFATLMAMLLGLSSCKGEDDDVMWDFSPIEIDIIIRDSEGHNLLDPDYEKNIIGSEVYMTCDDSRHDPQASCVDSRHDVEWMWGTQPVTRVYAALYYGIRHLNTNLYSPSTPSEWILKIGEFPGDENCDRTFDLVINGKTHKLRLVNSFKWRRNDPQIDTQIYLDGKECPRRESINIIL